MFFKKVLCGAVICTAIFVSFTATAATVTLTGVSSAEPRSGVYSGFYDLNVDGDAVLVMCDDFNTHVSIGDTWSANIFTYDDIVNGAPVKFASDLSRYGQMGWIFGQLSLMTAGERADANLAVWNIFTPGAVSMTAFAQSLYNDATSGAYDTFNFDGIMALITPNPLMASQEYGVDSASVGVSPVPVPSAVWLFGSGLLGLVGVARRRAA